MVIYSNINGCGTYLVCLVCSLLSKIGMSLAYCFSLVCYPYNLSICCGACFLLGAFMIIGAIGNMARSFFESFLAYFMEYFFQKCH